MDQTFWAQQREAGGVGRGEDHALAFNTAQHGRLEIGDDDDSLADDLRRLIRAFDAGDELSRGPFPDVNFKHQETVCIGMVFGGDDDTDL